MVRWGCSRHFGPRGGSALGMVRVGWGREGCGVVGVRPPQSHPFLRAAFSDPLTPQTKPGLALITNFSTLVPQFAVLYLHA